jgi:acyl-CoA dehydrogenase
MMTQYDPDMISMPVKPAWTDIRDAVGRLCEDFPNEYWLKLDKEDAYPHRFRGSADRKRFSRRADPRGIRRLWPAACGGGRGAGNDPRQAGCNAAACHAQMYTMGTVLKHGSPEQKQRYLPNIASGELRLQAFGVTEPTPAATPRS